MTTQEFVDTTAYEVSEFRFKGLLIDDKSLILAKQEYSNGIITGLTKGLEINCEFTDWVTMHLRRSFPNGVEEPVYFRNGINLLFEAKRPYTTSELLTIFLTEKYGK